MRSILRRRGAGFTGVTAALVLALTGCGGTAGSTGPGGDSPVGEGFAAVLESAPVAAEADLPQSPTLDAIRERGQLVVGGSLDAPLLSQQNPTTGEIEGFDAYMGKLFAKYVLGEPKVEIVNSASETREALLANGTVDVVLQTYTITEERAEQVAFAGPYYESGLAIMAPRDSGITGVEDLGGTVIAGANTPAIPAIEEHAPGAEIVTFGTAPECLEALRQGRGDAYVQDMSVLLGDADKYPELQVVGEPFTEDPYGIGLPKDDPAFKQFVNDWLEKIYADGTWAGAWKASIGTVVEGESPKPPEIGSVPGS